MNNSMNNSMNKSTNKSMSRAAFVLVAVSLAGAIGCGSQAVLFGTEGDYSFTVYDVIAQPAEQVSLRARLQSGDLLRPAGGYVVRFLRDGKLFKAAETDSEGIASVSFVPPKEGDYNFIAEPAARGFPDQPPQPQPLLVSCRKSTSPLMVVDLDKTLVASGFHEVLIGQPKPMPDSQKVMRRLAQRFTVVYLTHRPDYFGPKSRAWLRRQGYPQGVVILSDISGFLRGSEKYKSEALEELTSRFKRIEIGIGDKVSDAKAYHDNGIRAFLIIQPGEISDPAALRALADELETLDEAVQVVTGWDQIERAVFPQSYGRGEVEFPRSAMQAKLRKTADELDNAAQPQPEP